VRYWSDRTGLSQAQLLGWLSLSRSKYYQWRQRYGKVNAHNAWIPRDFWLLDWERQAIVDYAQEHPLDGYRRLTYKMLDDDIVAVCPSTTYRVLQAAGRFGCSTASTSRKGQGFVQPERAHEHWHVDVSYVNICGTFYYLCSVLDGFSRFVVHWEIRESMSEADVEIVLQRARERFPDARPRVITDNGPAFVAKDFKAFLRLCGYTHVRTSPYYPQSNGKVERWQQTVKRECIRPKTPLSLADARRMVDEFVTEYNTVRLHSAIGYVTPEAQLEGRAKAIHAARDRKLAAARLARQQRNKAQQTPITQKDRLSNLR